MSIDCLKASSCVNNFMITSIDKVEKILLLDSRLDLQAVFVAEDYI